MGQRTLDQVLMPPSELSEKGGSGIAVRDVASQQVISRLEHREAIDCLLWDSSGLQLVTCGQLGHQIYVHRAQLGAKAFKDSYFPCVSALGAWISGRRSG